jgi:hypothetical protein
MKQFLFRLKFLKGIALVMSTLAAGGDLSAVERVEPGSLPEHQIKALYLLNFTKYVDWPGESFERTNSYVIGIAGAADTCADLRGLATNRIINGRSLLIQPIERVEDARKCHMVYLGPGGEKLAAGILKAVKDTPVLTVGEQDDFFFNGGIIRFAREENKLRIEINLEASQKAGLTISARLLQIAKVIRPPRHPEGN